MDYLFFGVIISVVAVLLLIIISHYWFKKHPLVNSKLPKNKFLAKLLVLFTIPGWYASYRNLLLSFAFFIILFIIIFIVLFLFFLISGGVVI